MDERIDLQEFYKGLDLVFQKKNSTETMRYLESWLREAQRLEDKSGLVAVSNELGGLCRAMGQFARAKELHERVLVLLEEMGLGASEHYATALINLGDVYIMEKSHEQALELFLRAEQMLKRCGLDGDYRMAALCNNISMIYRDTGRLAEAEKALDQAFQIIKGLPQCRGELATTYINLGELQAKQQKLIMARESFQAAVDLFEADGGTDVHYSAACAGLGEVCFLSGNYREAAQHYEKALRLMERDFGKTPVYQQLAQNLERVRQYL